MTAPRAPQPHRLPLHWRLPAPGRRQVRLLREHQRVPVQRRPGGVRQQLQRRPAVRLLQGRPGRRRRHRQRGPVREPGPRRRHPGLHRLAGAGPRQPLRHPRQRHRVRRGRLYGALDTIANVAGNIKAASAFLVVDPVAKRVTRQGYVGVAGNNVNCGSPRSGSPSAAPSPSTWPTRPAAGPGARSATGPPTSAA
jgi:hypothetical protein